MIEVVLIDPRSTQKVGWRVRRLGRVSNRYQYLCRVGWAVKPETDPDQQWVWSTFLENASVFINEQEARMRIFALLLACEVEV